MRASPIVFRELLMAARKAATFRSRFWIPLGGVMISAMMVFSMEGRGVGASGQGGALFSSLSLLGFAYVLIVGARATADCISVEKRDGTLGLLFLTDLRGFDVVVGKFVARSLNSVYGLVGLIPILAIPLQMGGVTGMRFLQVVLCLLNGLFLSLTTGMFISALSEHDRKAMTGSLITILSVTFLPYALLMYVETIEGGAPLVLRLLVWGSLLLSPLSPFLLSNAKNVLESNFSGAFFSGLGSVIQQQGWGGIEIVFGISLVLSHLIAWGMLFGAAHSVVAFVRHERRWLWFEQIRQWGHRLIYGNEDERRAHRKSYLDLNPFSWLTSRERLKPRYVWIFLVSILVIYAWNLQTQGDVMFDDRTLIPLGFLIHAFLKIWIASEACFRIAEDRRTGALELLLSTPLGPKDIVRGQLLAIWRQFGGALLVLVFLELILIFNFATETRDVQEFRNRAMYLAASVMLLVDGATIGWLAMWNGVRQASANRAIARTIIVFLMVPWLVYWFGLAGWEVLRGALTSDGKFVIDFRWLGIDSLYYSFYWDRLNQAGRAVFWVITGVGFDVVLGLWWARRELLSRFREQVSGFHRAQG